MKKITVPTGNEECMYRPKTATGDLEPLEDDTEMKMHYGIRPRYTLYLSMKLSLHVILVSTGGSQVSVAINTSDSVQELKEVIQKRVGLLPEHQRLVLRGKLVRDDGYVRDYDIRNGDKLFLIRRYRESCNYNLTISHSGAEMLTLRVEPAYTVKRVKGMIADIETINQQHQNEPLRDSQKLKCYGSGRGSMLELNRVCSQLFVRNLAGKTITLDVGARDTIKNVKSMIESREGIPPEQQRLVFKGRQLCKGVLSKHGIQNDATLELSLCLCGGEAMEVFIKTTTGRTIIVQVDKDTTVLELKEKIYRQNGFPVEQQKLIFVGMILEDKLTMADYNIQKATTLHLVIIRPVNTPVTEYMPITVISHTGKEIQCRVAVGGTIESLMSAIKDLEGIPNYCQQLFSNGELLDCHKSLKHYNFDTSSSAKRVVYLALKGQIQISVIVLSSVGKYSAVKRFDKKLSLSVSTEMRVSTLKSIIEQREKIPIYFQTLLYNGNVMDDHQLLDFYSIDHKCLLHLWPERLHHMQLEVSVKTSNTEGLDLKDLSSNTKIIDVKRKCCRLIGTDAGPSSEQYSLFCDSMLLENGRSLHDYMVTCGSKLYLVPPEEFPIIVHTTTGNTLAKIFVNVRKSCTIKAVKGNVRSASGIIQDHPDLYLSSVLLNDDQTIGEYRISAACTLTAVPPGEIPISIKTRFATVPIAIEPSKPVKSIMQSISHNPAIGVPVHNQRLLLHRVLLSRKNLQGKMIKKLNITAGNTLNLVVVPDELDIYICTPRGSTLTLVCPTDYTIHDVKGAIEQSEGIPVESQVLPFTDEEKTLAEYGIEPGTHLDVGHLSVVPVKAAIDQQEKCECAIMQQNLKQELESKEVMFEMQLDSASNYMQTKISNFEEDLAQSREKIAELEKKNRLMKRKLAKEQEKMRYLEKKLVSATTEHTLYGRSLSEADTRVITCVSEEEEVEETAHPLQTTSSAPCLTRSQDPIQYGFSKESIYNGTECTLSCEENGIKINFPEHRINVLVMSLNISSDNCIFYDNAELVSAIYRVCISEPLPRPVTVEMEHCVTLSDTEDA